ncbi:biotin holocarboxylase synthetase [Coemansia sp. RSA 552]|nr:biotin holocarboxylase synthetase [Coemansia sp. RSA 552]
MVALNVLVYSGPGVGLNAHAFLMRTLRQFLSHRYAVISVTPEALRKEPWESKAALLVVPGGRDLPYTAEMNGEINRRIKAWVGGGGSYLGICAGAYYGSARCEFEEGSRLEVVGDRELGLFPGTCMGAAYPGYNYKSEDGARAVELAVDQAAFAMEPGFWGGDSDDGRVRVHFNGGGYFVAKDPADPRVTVLARYPSDVTDPRDRGRRISGAAALVGCTVGRGLAVLTGTHPEYAWDDLESGSYTRDHNRHMVAQLRRHDARRRRLVGAMLTYLRLHIDAGALGDTDALREPRPTPTFVVAARAADAADIAEVTCGLREMATQSGDSGDRVLRDADDIHVATAKAGAAGRRVEAGYERAVLGSDSSSSSTERRQALLVLCTPDSLPGADETPRFDMSAALRHMREERAHTIGSWLLYADTTWSTQTFLERNSKALAHIPDGAVSVATRQLAGRGRGRNAWVSPPTGCLQFTLLVRHPRLTQAPVVMLQYVMALALVEAVAAQPGCSRVPLRLKWPNDIYAETDDGPVKIGGVMVNSSFKNGVFTLLFGCGYNVANSLPTTSVNALLRAHSPPLPPLTVERALALVTAKFEELYRQFLAFGFAPLLPAYYARWLHSGQIVTLTDRGYEKARVVGINPTDGQLQVRSQASPSIVYELQPDGNSFDMLHGLISRKV